MCGIQCWYFFFPFHPNFSTLVTFLLWWSPTNVTLLQFWRKPPIPVRDQLLWAGSSQMEGRWEMGQSKVWQWGILFLLHCPSKDGENPQLSGLSPSQGPPPARSSSNKGQARTRDKQRPRPLRVESRKTKNMNTVKWHPSKETKAREWILMIYRGGRGWGGKDHDCYQLLEGLSQPHPRLSHGAWREEARRDVEDWLVSETPLRDHRQAWPRLLGHYLEKTMVMKQGRGSCGVCFVIFFNKTICSCYSIATWKMKV